MTRWMAEGENLVSYLVYQCMLTTNCWSYIAGKFQKFMPAFCHCSFSDLWQQIIYLSQCFFSYFVFFIIYSLGSEISVGQFVLSHRHLLQIRGSNKYIYYYSQHILFLSPYSCAIFMRNLFEIATNCKELMQSEVDVRALLEAKWS
jgi:hypothetical protein